MKELKPEERHPNRDPITGEPGSHPYGVGTGTAVGATAGALAGAAGGPIGAAAGAIVGGIAGGLTGKVAAEAVNPTVEDIYWRKNFSTRDYVRRGSPYEVYERAYRVGYEGFAKYGHHGRTYEEVEDNLRSDYEALADQTELGWDEARGAVQDAWQRVGDTGSARGADK